MGVKFISRARGVAPGQMAARGGGAPTARRARTYAKGDRAPDRQGAPASGVSGGLCGWASRGHSARILDGGSPELRYRLGAEPRERGGPLGDAARKKSGHGDFSARKLGPPPPRDRCAPPPSLIRTEVTRHHGIPVTTPVCTLVDIALRLRPGEQEAAINEADKRDLTDPEALRAALDYMLPRPGVGALRRLLDRRTFTFTDSELERTLSTARSEKPACPPPEHSVRVNGFKVDFYWPELGLVVETDGWRYHRTPAQQRKTGSGIRCTPLAGLTTLRFTRAQVRFEQGHVEHTLATVARRLQERAAG